MKKVDESIDVESKDVEFKDKESKDVFVVDLPVQNGDIEYVDVQNDIVYLKNKTYVVCKRVDLPTTCELHRQSSDFSEHFVKVCEPKYKLIQYKKENDDGVLIKNYKVHPHYSKFEFNAPSKEESAQIYEDIKKIQSVLGKEKK